MMRAVFMALFLMTLAEVAFARAGSGGATSGFTNPEDTKGLCTPENKDEAYYKEGYCKSLAELFEKDCVKQLSERIRQRYLAEGAEYQKALADKNIKAEDKTIDNSNFECGTKDGKSNLLKLAKDPQKWNYFMGQLISATVVTTSDWNVLNKVTDSPQNATGSQGPGQKGLLDLELGKGIRGVDNPNYACGCDVTNSPGKEGVTVQSDEGPGPADGHHSIVCGAYMALYWIDKDGKFLEGNTKPDEQKKTSAKGMARIFQKLERASDAKQDPAPLKLVREKMKTFCEKDTGAGKTTTWDRTLKNDIGLGDGSGDARR